MSSFIHKACGLTLLIATEQHIVSQWRLSPYESELTALELFDATATRQRCCDQLTGFPNIVSPAFADRYPATVCADVLHGSFSHDAHLPESTNMRGQVGLLSCRTELSVVPIIVQYAESDVIQILSIV